MAEVTSRQRRRLSDDQIDEMARLRERGWSSERIAAHFGEQGVSISANAINWQCLRVGADAPLKFQGRCTQPTEPYNRGGHIVRPFSAADDALLLTLEAQGINIAEIARRISRKPNSVKGRLMTLARRDARAELREAA
ncbi:hypothetical protein [Sphingomonas sp. TF3]|uniref:hypothetical protein n=2 Tax=Pseudomonadota TaxID=1224 RepID=UPI000F892AB1|nr:hypothetical protein [Sphingomonas sp. TF3]RUN77292.1 hypothetical protein EJC47_07375 [Sphingomonas sp. TF3]